MTTDHKDSETQTTEDTKTIEENIISEKLLVEDTLLDIPDDIEAAISTDRDESGYTAKNYEDMAISKFSDVAISDKLLETLDQLGWKKPTDVQGLCLPHTIKGEDVAGFAQTGTGKTGVFLITVAHRLLMNENRSKGTSCIILAPTRELAIQIEEECKLILKPVGISSLAVYGGIDYDKQARALEAGVDVIVATPGRLIDYTKKKIVDLRQVSMFICDEVDRMFEMGFIEDVEYFLGRIDEKAQKLFFSATTNENVKELSFEYLNKPHYISVNPDEITPDRVLQQAVLCETTQKLKVFMGLLRQHYPSRAIIFTNTKLTAAWLHYKLKGNNFNVDVITGDLPQNKRIGLIKRIKEGQIKFLIATDVASRGLHIADVTHVYNFDIPADAANYVHRIGRTARAGAKGQAYSLVCEEYAMNMLAINELLGDSKPEFVWFPEDYLDISDQSGDPFKDNFGKKSEAQPSNPRRIQERRPRGDESRGHESRGQEPRGPHQNSKPRRERKPDQKRTEANRQGANQQGPKHSPGNPTRPRHPHKITVPKPAPQPMPQQKEASFGSLVKKMFGALLGKKS